MTINLKRLGICTLLSGEILGFLALALTPDVERIALTAIPIAIILLFLTGVRFKDRTLFLLMGTIVAVSAYTGYFGDQLIAITLSRAMIALHGLLWLSRHARDYRFWRLGIAFLEIILAAILSPETHMFLLIFFFAMIASLSLSFGFLERKFGRQSDPAIPLQFLGAIFFLTFLVFLSSLVIFPILPRSSGTGLGRQWAEPGYTETVNLRSSLSWAAGSSRPMLWIFRPEGSEWPQIVPFGLLRGAVLDHFTGDEWRPGAKQFEKEEPPPSSVKVEIIREPMNTNILPTPYGTVRVEFNGRERGHYLSGEWPALAHRNRRMKYEVELGGPGPSDNPKSLHLERTDPKLFPTISRLTAEWNRQGSTEAEKISRVLQYFRDFRWSLAPMEGTEAGGLHPVENFLQHTKEGHCELFATSAALLFRGMGMPARVVAGFRVYPSGDVLTARNTNAHAWAEVWVKGRGWVPVDPSPITAVPVTWAIFDLYDELNAYWYQYIVGYEFDGRALFARLRGPGLTAIGVLFFLYLLIRFARRFVGVKRHPRIRVTRAWAKIEKSLGNKIHRPEAGDLRRRYLELRFGRREPQGEEIESFRQRAAVLIRSFAAK